MPWFWGSSAKKEEEEDDASYEEYTDSEGEEEEGSYEDEEEEEQEEVTDDEEEEEGAEEVHDGEEEEEEEESSHSGNTDGHVRAAAPSPTLEPQNEVVNGQGNYKEKNDAAAAANATAVVEVAESSSAYGDDDDDENESVSSSDETDEQVVKGVIPEAVEVDSHDDDDHEDGSAGAAGRRQQQTGGTNGRGAGVGRMVMTSSGDMVFERQSSSRVRADSAITIEGIGDDDDDDESESGRGAKAHPSGGGGERTSNAATTNANKSKRSMQEHQKLKEEERYLEGLLGGETDDDDGDESASSSIERKPSGGDSSSQSQASTAGGDDDDGNAGSTSTAEKHSLLVLAAEHDRVDILQAILKEASSKEERDDLLSPLPSVRIPPLHIAVAYGSVNATNCLLRMGADPSIRPDVPEIQITMQQNRAEAVEISNINRYDDVTAWELVFGNGEAPASKKSSWGIFSSSSNIGDENRTDDASGNGGNDRSQHANNPPRRRRRGGIDVVDLQPSKREGIRHGFTAEALRCIGSDEYGRLQQLLDSGMPATVDIGGKDLFGWATEMDAKQCQQILHQPSTSTAQTTTTTEKGDKEEEEEQDPAAEYGMDVRPSAEGEPKPDAPQRTASKGKVLDRPNRSSNVPGAKGGGDMTSLQMINRLDELDSLSMALSVSLDGLAEEASVCNGLLLMGGGATALAAHVKSLKNTKRTKLEELERMIDVWENAKDELAYWVREGGAEGMEIANRAFVNPSASDLPPGALRRRSSLLSPDDMTPEQEQQQQRQLKAQIAASEQKILKLRASIADLSEACARDLAEVEKRGLSGGIQLVRTLRDEIREIDFQLSEAKNGEGTCRIKINLIQSKINAATATKKKHENNSHEPISSPDAANATTPRDGTNPSDAASSTSSNSGVGDYFVKNMSMDPRNGESNRKAQPPYSEHEQNAKESQQQDYSTGNASADNSGSGGAKSQDPGHGESDDGEAGGDGSGSGEPMIPTSEEISSGKSTAIAVRSTNDGQGFFPVSLWQILLRIIGFQSETTGSTSGSRRATAPRSGNYSVSSSSSSQPQPVMLL